MAAKRKATKASKSKKTEEMAEGAEGVEGTEVAPVAPVIKPKVVEGKDRISRVLGRELFQKMAKEHGKLVLTRASDARVAKSHRIPSGIFELDRKMGGGWPVGRVNTIFGMKSTGKSTALTRTIASAQRMCSRCWTFVDWKRSVEKDVEIQDESTGEVVKTGEKKLVKESFYCARWWYDGKKWRVLIHAEMDDEGVPRVTLGEEIFPECPCKEGYRESVCAYIDVEGTLDKAWVVRNGVDLFKLMLSQPEYAEQSLDIADALVRSGEIDVLILDSVAFLTPEKEIAESTSKETIGVQARIVGKGVRKFVSGLNAVGLHSERRPTIFLTNQLRMKIGVMFGNPETQSAGLAPGFASSVEVRTNGGEYTFENVEGKDSKEPGGKTPVMVELKFDVVKNKVDIPKQTGSYKIILVDGVTKNKGDLDEEDAILDAAKACGLLVETPKGWTIFEETYSAFSHVKRRLMTDKLFTQNIKWVILDSMQAVERSWANSTRVDPNAFVSQVGESKPLLETSGESAEAPSESPPAAE